MNHRALVRPPLPGTTPAPGPLGKSSVYATRVPAQLEPLSIPGEQLSPTKRPYDRTYSPGDLPTPVRDIRTPSETMKQRALQEKALSRMTAKLPFELRESVTAVVKMAFSASQRMQEDMDLNNQELLVLRSEVAAKTRDNHTLHKANLNCREQIRGMAENIDSLKDEISTRQNFTIRNRSAMTRLASTNRMLIDVLDALQTSTGQNNSKLLQELARQAEVDVEDEVLTEGTDKQALRRPGKLAPITAPRDLAAAGPNGSKNNDEAADDYEDKEQKKTMFQNDKLRESLLKVAREHYRSTKNAEVLEAKVMELKGTLRAQEMLNRKLKSELDEIKIIHRVDTVSVDEIKPGSETSKSFRVKTFGQLDGRFQALLDRNVFDPLDGIQQLRRILAHMSSAPSSLSLFDMIDHIVSSDVMRIFDADMVCLYLVKPGADTVMHKFTTRSKTPTTVDMGTTRSLAAETIRSGKAQRLNIVSNSAAYHPDIDGCVGVITKRIMSLPLFHSQNLSVLGAVQFLNKAQGRDAFAEVDELFGLIFANQAAVFLSECVMYDAMFFHAQLLQGLLEASTELFSVVPDPSTTIVKPLHPGEILAAMERISRELLKCPHTRAFLLESCGELVMLQPVRSSSLPRYQQNTDIVAVPMHSGIAGHVITTKQPYLLENVGLDQFWNPLADLDPLDQPMLTVPLIDLHGTVLGCLQLLASSRSPRMKQSNDVNDFRLLFSQAAHWLTHQMAPALSYLLSFMGRPARQPTATPSKLTRASIDAAFRPSFFSASDEAVGQIVAAEPGGYRDSTSVFVTIPMHPVFPVNVFPEQSAVDSPARARTESTDKRVHFVQTVDGITQTDPLAEPSPVFVPTVVPTIAEEQLPVDDKVDLSVHSTALARISQQDEQITQLQADLHLAQTILRAHVDEHDVMKKTLDVHINEQIGLKSLVTQLQGEAAAMNEHLHEAKRSSDTQHDEVLRLQQSLDAVKAERDGLLTTLSAQQDQANSKREDLHAQLCARIDTQAAEAVEHAALLADMQATVARLSAELEKKDKVQAILQDQVVRLAGQNLKDINAAIDSNSNASKPKEVEHAPTADVTPAKVVSPLPAEDAPASSPPLSISARSAPPIGSAKGSPRAPPPATPSRSPPQSQEGSLVEGDWQQQVDELGQIYYYNNKTGESAWELPADSEAEAVASAVVDMPVVAAAADPDGEVMRGEWLQQFDELGREYWLNQTTGESAWEVPEDGNQPAGSLEGSLQGNIHGSLEGSQHDEDEDEEAAPRGQPSIYDTNASQFSATAGDYTIEL